MFNHNKRNRAGCSKQIWQGGIVILLIVNLTQMIEKKKSFFTIPKNKELSNKWQDSYLYIYMLRA